MYELSVANFRLSQWGWLKSTIFRIMISWNVHIIALQRLFKLTRECDFLYADFVTRAWKYKKYKLWYNFSKDKAIYLRRNFEKNSLFVIRKNQEISRKIQQEHACIARWLMRFAFKRRAREECAHRFRRHRKKNLAIRRNHGPEITKKKYGKRVVYIAGGFVAKENTNRVFMANSRQFWKERSTFFYKSVGK